MKFYFAPLQGITGYVYRNAHHKLFPGDISKYFTPFLAANQSRKFKTKGLKDIQPEYNADTPVIPQLLTNHAKDFIDTAKRIREMGYDEINLNLGCPAKTVVTKKKGSGFLAYPDELDAFLEEIFSNQVTKISIKTRIGLESRDEWPRLMEIYNRYPLEELIIHPRTQTDQYENDIDLELFRDALSESKNPVCYNGDIVKLKDFDRFTESFPSVNTVMIGRGLLIDPAFVRTIRTGASFTKDQLQTFHDTIYQEYQNEISGDSNILFAMKEFWSYPIQLFQDSKKHAKKIKKAQNLTDYTIAVALLFEEREMIERL